MPSRAFLPIILLALALGANASSPSGPSVGSTAPGFSAHDLLSGQTIRLDSQRGKVVVLAFWNSRCGSCRRELPLLDKAQTLIGQDKLTVFAASFREEPTAASAIRKMASGWHLKMVDDHDGVIAKLYAISTIPYLFIIGRDGKVLANHVGYGDRTLQELIDDINHALAGDPAGASLHPVLPPFTVGCMFAQRLAAND